MLSCALSTTLSVNWNKPIGRPTRDFGDSRWRLPGAKDTRWWLLGQGITPSVRTAFDSAEVDVLYASLGTNTRIGGFAVLCLAALFGQLLAIGSLPLSISTADGDRRTRKAHSAISKVICGHRLGLYLPVQVFRYCRHAPVTCNLRMQIECYACCSTSTTES